MLVIGIVQAQDSVSIPDRRLEELGKHYEALREHSSLVLEKIQQESRILLFTVSYTHLTLPTSDLV